MLTRRSLADESSIRGSLGDVIAGTADGRKSVEEITIFDGTGVALQDLVVADLAVRRAIEKGLGVYKWSSDHAFAAVKARRDPSDSAPCALGLWCYACRQEAQ
ncbi:hypothetical protein ACVOMV_34645 [Mesorhizobium atlanticum]